MVRIFNIYYPTRMLFLLSGEALIVSASFLLAALIHLHLSLFDVLVQNHGLVKILAVTALALLCSYYLDLYDTYEVLSAGQIHFRLLAGIGTLSLILGAVGYFVPGFLFGNAASLTGVMILTAAVIGWRAGYSWLIRIPAFRERVYVLGNGERANLLFAALRDNKELGMDVVGWRGATDVGFPVRDDLGMTLLQLQGRREIDRVIVALNDRRGIMPVSELLELRLADIKIDEATALLEKIQGKIEVDELNPSWLLFADGFRLDPAFLFVRKVMSSVAATLCGLVVLPLIPFIVLATKLGSPGPILYSQKRVGYRGRIFTCYKFRTMRTNAEAYTGPTWAGDDDPRITPIGRWLRKLRLDELPQLWNVLKGDMGFVGPRPERPEFVESLRQSIPYYNLRHTIRPGITGWAQVRYRYGSTVEDAKEKLRYDLFYIKNLSISLDLLIVFLTIKTVLFGRGSR